ncbi:MAG: DUF3006 domain-containing protein [Ruminococcus sp.]|nr:DUF3006 domain-containing protein [Ruminococcus sp.]
MIIIDRLEGSMAVLEIDGNIENIDRSLLPEGAKEGDILLLHGGGYTIDRERTEQRRRAAADRLRKILRRNE